MDQKKWIAAKCYQCGKVVEEKNAFIVDEEKDLIFCSEECLYKHFAQPIIDLEKEFGATRSQQDILQSEFPKYEECLGALLEAPSEIWEDTETFPGLVLHQYIGEFVVEEQNIFYVAIVRQTKDAPSFVFLHFPTIETQLVEHYRRGRMTYDKSQSELEIETSEGDALEEGDERAKVLFEAMLSVRQKNDLPEPDFEKYLSLRQESIEEADEIWRHTDLEGNTLVHFIKECEFENEMIHYIVVTIEDGPSGSHFILFSFPTKDSQLVERYRQGDNLTSELQSKPDAH